MSDVFISYARSTAAQAQAVAGALRSEGFSIWFDENLPAHRAFAEVIEERLTAAGAVLVIWSAEAAKSEWVQSEADAARAAHKLVQMTVDGTRLPMPFDRIQCADLSGWTGDLAAPGWRKVLASVRDLIGEAAPALARPSHAVVQTEPVLAVLAFDNLSGDAEMAYFSDGVSEEILHTVARGADLKVIGRASGFQFRGAEKAASKVSAALKATHILDGSVRRSGFRVRISAQLIECGGETTLWSHSYDRDLTDIFALQDEIAAAVAAALKTTFSRSGPPPGKLDPAAYDLFLRGRDPSLTDALAPRVEMLERCVAHAPDFASGWAWLAFFRAEYAIFERGALAIDPLVNAARAAVATAERLDPTMGFTRMVRAELEPYAAFHRREALLTEGLSLTPGDVSCLTGMAWVVGEVGRLREALAFAEDAWSRDPLFPEAASQCAVMLDDDYQAQTARYDAMRAKWPGRIESSLHAAAFAAANADWPRYEALRRHAYAQPFAGMAAHQARMLRTFGFYDAIRDRDQAYLDDFEERLLQRVERTGWAPLEALWSAGAAGRVEAAFEAVERSEFDAALLVGGQSTSGWWPGTIFLRRFNAALIEDPRFLRLCAKLGLVHYWLETDRWPDCARTVPYDFRAEARKVAAEGLMRHV